MALSFNVIVSACQQCCIFLGGVVCSQNILNKEILIGVSVNNFSSDFAFPFLMIM